jgi:hypothetical protein
MCDIYGATSTCCRCGATTVIETHTCMGSSTAYLALAQASLDGGLSPPLLTAVTT